MKMPEPIMVPTINEIPLQSAVQAKVQSVCPPEESDGALEIDGADGGGDFPAVVLHRAVVCRGRHYHNTAQFDAIISEKNIDCQ